MSSTRIVYFIIGVGLYSYCCGDKSYLNCSHCCFGHKNTLRITDMESLDFGQVNTYSTDNGYATFGFW